MTFRQVWDGTFWSVVGLAGIGALVLIFASEGSQDAAGRGMQSGFGIILLLIVAALGALAWFFRTPYLRVPIFVVLALPLTWFVVIRLSEADFS